MVLFIFNETEMRNADNDAPLAANTPSTGSLSTGHVEQCGNRVLELIEQHKKEIQARMAKREVGFRGILENKDNNNKPQERGTRKSDSRSRTGTIYNSDYRSQREEATHQSPRTFMDQPSRKSLSNQNPAFPQQQQRPSTVSTPKSNHNLSSNAQSSIIAQAYMDAVKQSEVSVAETNFNSPPTQPTSSTSNRESFSSPQLSNVLSDEYFELPQPYSSTIPCRRSLEFEGGNESQIVQVPVTPTRARSSSNTVRFSNSPHKEVEDRRVSPLTPLMTTTTSNGKPKSLPTRQPEQIVLKSQQSPQIREVDNECIYETEDEESDGDFWNCGCIGDFVGGLHNNNNDKSTTSFNSADRIPSHITNDILQESRLATNGPVQALLSRTPTKSFPFNNNIHDEGISDMSNEFGYSSSSDEEDPFNGAAGRGRFAAFFLWIWESFILLWIRLWRLLRDNSWEIEVFALIAVLIAGIFLVTMDYWKHPRWLRQESKQYQYYGPVI